MIMWLDLSFKDYANPDDSLSGFAKEFDMTSDEANDLFKIWLRVEDHRNWIGDLCEEEECDEEGSKWTNEEES